MKLELKPCPMCGAKDPEPVIYILRWLDKHEIQCNRCRYHPRPSYTLRGALKRWNRIKVEGESR